MPREYGYEHFQRDLLTEDADFQSGPGPGGSLPDFDLQLARGGWIRRQDVANVRPLLLLFGSFT